MNVFSKLIDGAQKRNCNENHFAGGKVKRFFLPVWTNFLNYQFQTAFNYDSMQTYREREVILFLNKFDVLKSFTVVVQLKSRPVRGSITGWFYNHALDPSAICVGFHLYFKPIQNKESHFHNHGNCFLFTIVYK